MNPKELVTRSPFEGLFPVDLNMLETIAESMRATGYDDAFPILVWEGTVIDGHTRLLAALDVGIRDVPTMEKRFEDEDAALAYAIHAQRDRRNLTTADIVRCVKAVDKRKAGRGPAQNTGSRDPANSDPDRSADTTAAIVGVSSATVKRIRTVEDHGTPEVKRAMETGKISIKAAAEEVQRQRKVEEASTMKETEKAPKKRGAVTLPCDGPKYAHMAIDALSKIRRNDTYRKQALDMVERWIKENR